jgi:hypothetical protein
MDKALEDVSEAAADSMRVAVPANEPVAIARQRPAVLRRPIRSVPATCSIGRTSRAFPSGPGLQTQ